MSHTVSIVIPNWNGKELLKKNLPAVLHAAEKLAVPFIETIVVDDGSTDRSDIFIKENFPAIQCLKLKTNKGFHQATNIGVQKSTGTIVILLNTDMEPHPDAFIHLIKHFDTPALFGVSGRIYADDKKTFLYGNRGAHFKWGHFYLSEKKESDTSQNLFVCGGAGAFSREKFLALDGFDTLFSPFYYEEQDISYRALKRGWDIHYEPESIMYHQIRGTIEKKMDATKIKYISARNNYLFVIKNITDPSYTLQVLLFIPLFLLKDLFTLRFRFWIAFCMAVPRLPKALIKRIKEQKHIRRNDKEILSCII
ncbi:MAG: glycosyltransferase [Candidatus Omnitrophica bacterium]|nr:glycosyltransferase [Candidatus Omnitrophota bacterium]